MKTLLLFLALFIPANAQQVRWGGLFVAVNRVARVDQNIAKTDWHKINATVTAVFRLSPSKKHPVNFQVFIVQPMYQTRPLFGFGFSTRIF